MSLIQLFVRTVLIPFAFILGCPTAVNLLSKFGHKNRTFDGWGPIILGDNSTWTIILCFVVWALVFLKTPAKTFAGPTSFYGYTPVYNANGVKYYVTTCVTFISLCYIDPLLPERIYNNVPALLSTLNILALVLCGYLWWKGKNYPEIVEPEEPLPFIFEFYRGLEINPRLLNVDVKQLTNCRIGMMGWQLLIFVYWIESYKNVGLNWGITVSVILQTVYIAKFFWWETGYCNTIDMMLDRAGFYICWGCLVFLPGFYAFTTYYFVSHPPEVSLLSAFIMLVLGLLCIVTCYLIDHDKEIFKATQGERGLWRVKPEHVEVTYRSKSGLIRKTKLLASGGWGLARHLNYVFEVAGYYVWSLPGYNLGVWPFLCAIFLNILLVHRTYRDDKKCLQKYGAGWHQYCQIVKYKLIPYVY